MTVQQAIERANKMKAGNAVPDEMKIEWLNELEATIYDELILTHLHKLNGRWWRMEQGKWAFQKAPVYVPGEDDDTELIAERPYDEIYVYWLMAKIDLFSQELNKYDNDFALFDNQYQRYKRFYNKYHKTVPMPEIKVGVFR